MTTIKVVEPPTSWNRIPDGELVDAIVHQAPVEKKMPFQNRETGEDVYNFEWIFEVTSGPYSGKRVYANTRMDMYKHPECRLYTWSCAILNQELDLNQNFHTEALEGLPCRILVGLREYETKQGEARSTNFVRDVLPEGGGTLKVGKPTPAPIDEEPF